MFKSRDKKIFTLQNLSLSGAIITFGTIITLETGSHLLLGYFHIGTTGEQVSCEIEGLFKNFL